MSTTVSFGRICRYPWTGKAYPLDPSAWVLDMTREDAGSVSGKGNWEEELVCTMEQRSCSTITARETNHLNAR